MICFLKKKSDTTSHPRCFCERVNTQTGRYSSSVRSDQRGEFVNNEWITYCFKKGIIHEMTAAYSPESNGIAERVNLILANMYRPSLIDLPS
jgi:transposase InsO family protein